MVERIDRQDLIGSSAIRQQQELLGVENKISAKNPYAQITDLVDETDISDEALKLYEQDKDIQKYKKLVLDSLDDTNNPQVIKDLINNGKYQVPDEDLAQSMMSDEDFINMLF